MNSQLRQSLAEALLRTPKEPTASSEIVARISRRGALDLNSHLVDAMHDCLLAMAQNYPGADALVGKALSKMLSALSSPKNTELALLRSYKRLERDVLKAGYEGREMECLKWLHFGIEDLFDATKLFESKSSSARTPRYRNVFYLCQQAVEKTGKGLMLLTYPTITVDEMKKAVGHNLCKLLEKHKPIIAGIDPALRESVTRAVEAINPHATQFRYPSPNVLNTRPSEEEAIKILRQAHVVMRAAVILGSYALRSEQRSSLRATENAAALIAA